MSRIRKGYETRFRWLLQRVNARRLDQGVGWFAARAQQASSDQQIRYEEALARVYDDVAAKPAIQKRRTTLPAERFFCDAGLGGLARWLRAAGHEALWTSGIDDDELLVEARELGATILTTDSMLMERRILRDRLLPSLWLPPSLSIEEQLSAVFREFNLSLRAPRCMSCGGRLIPSEKEKLRERIPPRTYLWRNEYFVCANCGKLFWHGTHWEKIVRTLKALEP
ncbi:MAG TPA: Mut7-C RNAse domain-containing protein [Candidatus Limnocylindrales bacterium]|nr:Mut7-C RNAse domain-containing protein [Candidatus Limnocylindrales bacterium]